MKISEYPIEMAEETPFSTSIFRAVLNNPHINLLQKINEVKQQDPKGRVVSNSGGWQSQIYSGGNHVCWMDGLLSELGVLISPIYKAYGIDTPPKVGSYWFNINKRYDYNLAHNHPRCIFSGIFYLKVPKNSGNLTFKRPDLFHTYFSPDRWTDRNIDTFNYNPIDKMFLFFPWYLEHYVGQNLCEDFDSDRISIAINFE
jgi:uncharacterized protein (TIGR02466 family)